MRADETCGHCGHSLAHNSHGPDQNDFELDEQGEFVGTGRCTYCRVCSPGLDKRLKEKGK